MSTDIRLSKAKISKIIQSGGFLGSLLSKLASPLVNNNSYGKSSPSNIFKIILKVVPVLSLTAVFSFF